MCLGMKAATAINSCIYCTINKDDRYVNPLCALQFKTLYNIFLEFKTFYSSVPINKQFSYFFTLRQNFEKSGTPRSMSDRWNKDPGCRDFPLYPHVDVDNHIIDELHLLLRVTDRLEEGMIHNVIDRDQVSMINRLSKSLLTLT